MKILFISGHAFLPSTRKAGTHFVSEALAKRGHSVCMLSVGYSQLTRLKNPKLYGLLAANQKNRFVAWSPTYRSGSYLPSLHPFSSKSPWLNRLTSLHFRLYGRLLPRFMRDEIAAADAVLLESGTAICFLEAIRRINEKAVIVYFRRDRMDTIGASRYLVELERRLAPKFDFVSANSPRMVADLPATTRVKYLPQGLRKSSFDACTHSPYPVGSRNGIVVGDMLFDRDAVAAMARNNPHVTFHLFGNGLSGDFSDNVKCYGERPFDETVPFIKFADFGIAPYRMAEKERYLVESSLKLLQYSYCLLPILAPELLSGVRTNIITYEQDGERDWAGVVERVLAARRSPSWRDGILSWEEVAAKLETDLAEACRDAAPQPHEVIANQAIRSSSDYRYPVGAEAAGGLSSH
jgi:2-beta-glucuronyltransferase